MPGEGTTRPTEKGRVLIQSLYPSRDTFKAANLSSQGPFKIPHPGNTLTKATVTTAPMPIRATTKA